MENIIQDLRYGIRVLLKSPAFTAVAVIALALGIGANTAVFSVVNGVLLKPLPYKDAERLVLVLGANLTTGQIFGGAVSPPDFIECRERQQAFQRLRGSVWCEASLPGGADPERVKAARVSEGYFETLGVEPI